MYPRLFEIPFLDLTIGTFGPMMVLGFLAALFMMRRLSRRASLDRAMITNAALYSLIIGVVGARAFFVVHYFEQFREDPLNIFATWHGGLEFLGGVIPAIGFLLFYLHHHKLPVRRYLDIMAIGLMMGLAFGRIGCFLNGDCFGKPTDLPWGVRFPYRSFVYISQINSDLKRNRPEPHLKLPQSEYLSFYDKNGKWYPKDLEELTEQQRYEVTRGRYRCLGVHPSQLYSSANALLLCGILYFFWRKNSVRTGSDKASKLLGRPGSMVGLMFVLYGLARFLLEFIRDDNPYEFGILTISQILGIAMFVLGVVLLVILPHMKSDTSDGKEAVSANATTE
jgi:phosphatidylglycerol:prolipoprotein diacylglycerol transferase